MGTRRIWPIGDSTLDQAREHTEQWDGAGFGIRLMKVRPLGKNSYYHRGKIILRPEGNDGELHNPKGIEIHRTTGRYRDNSGLPWQVSEADSFRVAD